MNRKLPNMGDTVTTPEEIEKGEDTECQCAPAAGKGDRGYQR